MVKRYMVKGLFHDKSSLCRSVGNNQKVGDSLGTSEVYTTMVK